MTAARRVATTVGDDPSRTVMDSGVTRTITRRQGERTRYAALALLLVLLSGLSISVFTHDWIAYLPTHDHLLLNARALGLTHHAHHGDALSQALAALQPVGTSHEEPGRTDQLAPPFAPARSPLATRGWDALAGQPQADQPGGVVSLKSLSGLQPEINSYTATGLFALIALLLAALRGTSFASERALLRGGESYAPPSPPPRPA